MSLAMNDEWSALASRWQDRSEPVRISRDLLLWRERRRRVGMVFLVGIEVVISLAGLGAAWAARAGMEPAAGAAMLAVVVVYTALIWTFALWNRRGTWRPEHETVAGFLAVTGLRCRRGLRAARFAMGVVVVQAALSAVWVGSIITREGAAAVPRSLRALGLSLLIGLGFLIWAVWYRRRMHRKLTWLTRWSPEIVEQGGRA